MFMKSLTAGVLAVSLTMTSLTPTPATAAMSEEDAVIGVISLLLLGAAIHNNRSDGAQPAPTPVTQPNPRGGWRELPAQCRSDITRRNGNTIRMFTQRCLNTNYTHVNRLPEVCRVQVRSQNGQNRSGFRAACLRDQGFRTNQR